MRLWFRSFLARAPRTLRKLLNRRTMGARNEIQLELGHLFRDVPERGEYLSRLADVRHGLDIGDSAVGLDHRALDRFGGRRSAHGAECVARPFRQRLCGIVPQHSAAGADVPLVFRAAGGRAAGIRHLAQAIAECVLLHRGRLPRPLHFGARRRAGARRHLEPAAAVSAWPASRWGSRCRRPTATCCCRWRTGSSCRR